MLTASSDVGGWVAKLIQLATTKSGSEPDLTLNTRFICNTDVSALHFVASHCHDFVFLFVLVFF